MTSLLINVNRHLSSLTAPSRPCCSCSTGTMRFIRHHDVIEYHGHERAVESLGWWCNECGEAIFDGKELAERERVFLEIKASVDSQ